MEGAHAGGIGTIASGSYQTVVGRYNVVRDQNSVFIVGNGTDNGSRKNIIEAKTDRIILDINSVPQYACQDEAVSAGLTAGTLF